MFRSVYRALLLVCMMAPCGYLNAQATKAVILRLLDGKTGHLVASTGVLVRANHDTTDHGDWSKQNEDGTTALKIPGNVSVLQVHATYDDSTEYFVNCDSPKEFDTPGELWYAVADIMAAGVVAPDGCIKPKALKKLQVTAKPGELVLFVRKLNWREQSLR